MAAGKEDDALPSGSRVEGFVPMEPPMGDQSTSRRLQHIVVSNGSPATFGHVVSKQWRADSANGRSTWAVVGTPLEVGLLKQDLISGDASDVLGQGISDEDVTTPSDGEPVPDQGIVVITFEHLVKFLSDCLQPEEPDEEEGGEWEPHWDPMHGNPTFVMNFGFGDMSFEMAFACPLVVGLIDATSRYNMNVLMACTVSSDNRPYFGREWREVRTQDIAAAAAVQSTLNLRSSEPREGDGRDGGPQEIERLLSDFANDDTRTGEGRTLLLMNLSLLRYFPEGRAPQFADGAEPLRAPTDLEPISLDNRTTYTGQVSGISEVVIFPYADGVTVVRGQKVCGTGKMGVPRSRAEIMYYARWNQESEPQPRVSVPMTREQFEQLDPHCETSAAHTQGLTRLLVCCKLIWPGLAFADMPVLLPSDEDAIADELRNLSVMGILVAAADVPNQAHRHGSREPHELYRLTPLTSLGRRTGMLLKQGVCSVHSAYLLAQLSGGSAEGAALDGGSGVVREAILALSVLTDMNARGETIINRVVSSVEGGRGDESWYRENLKGVAKDKAGRGPIWLALGIWHLLMHDYRLRGTLGWSEGLKKANPWPPQLLNGELYVDVERSLWWDRRLEAFNAIRAGLSGEMPLRELGDASLTPRELLSVEVALVRALMDRIMVVVDHGEDFEAWDMASGARLSRPIPTQEPQVWWESCRRRDTLPSGETYPGVFYVYTYLEYAFGPDGKTKVVQPVDPTYVSALSVRLAFEGTDACAFLKGETLQNPVRPS